MVEKIKKWYKWGLWTKEMVQKAVNSNLISQEEMLEICGEN